MSRPEEVLRELPPTLRWRHGPGPGPITDVIDMEYLLGLVEKPELRSQILVLGLEANAQVMRILADTYQKAAGLVSGAR